MSSSSLLYAGTSRHGTSTPWQAPRVAAHACNRTTLSTSSSWHTSSGKPHSWQLVLRQRLGPLHPNPKARWRRTVLQQLTLPDDGCTAASTQATCWALLCWHGRAHVATHRSPCWVAPQAVWEIPAVAAASVLCSVRLRFSATLTVRALSQRCPICSASDRFCIIDAVLDPSGLESGGSAMISTSCPLLATLTRH